MKGGAKTLGRWALAAPAWVHLACVASRTALALAGLRAAPAPSDAGAPLPPFTVLGPMHDEPERVDAWLEAVAALDYPAELLDVQLLLEEDDAPTLDAARTAERGMGRPAWLRVVPVPGGGPRTKPNALNHGLSLARGELLVVYDAEDAPDPRQLRDAAARFAASPAEVACVQAEPVIDVPPGPMASVMAADYRFWHGGFLPGLARIGAPVPLAGTSNHLRVQILRRLGGWDERNVTEDAELGVRLALHGYRTATIPSRTLESSVPPGIPAWIRQRSRWSKGYAITWWRFARSPRRRALPLRSRACVHLALAGTLAVQVSGPLVLGALVATPRSPAGRLAAASIGLRLIGLRLTRRGAPGLGALNVVAPVVWALEGVAAARGVLQLAGAPDHWEKTAHPPVGG